MSDPLFLSIDMGTTAAKVGVIDSDGRLVSAAAKEYSLQTPRPSIVELHPEVYRRMTFSAVRDAVSAPQVRASEILSIAISCQGETLISIDAHGAPLRNAVVWMDTRATEEAESLRSLLPMDARTGLAEIAPEWPASKLLWLRRNEPEHFQGAAKHLLLEDYLIYLLCGEIAGEYSLYTTSCLLDISRKSWWQEMVNVVGLRADQLSLLTESGRIVGRLRSQVARELGLSQEVVVVTGAMDQTAGVVGAGSITPGMVTETTGAAEAVCMTLAGFPQQQASSVTVQYHALPNQYLAIGWCPAGGMSLRWLRDTFLSGSTYEEMLDLAEEVANGSDGLLFFPFMGGVGTLQVDPRSRGCFYGLELSHGTGHFVRAIVEAIAYILCQTVESFEPLSGRAAEVRVMGGGSRSTFWNQVKSAVTGRPVVPVESTDAALVGVAILQAVALGIYSSVEEATHRMVHLADRVEATPELQQTYKQHYRQYREVLTRFFD